MAKSQRNQTYVLKLNTSYMKKHDWNVTFDLSEIRKQSQLVVSLGSSQVLRWLETDKNNDVKAGRLKKDIKRLRKDKAPSHCVRVRYNALYETQFQQDYVMLVMDSKPDYRYACKHGFAITINYPSGISKTVHYKRFLGTAGSIKKSTIMFVNENRYEDLIRRINNGRYSSLSQFGENLPKTSNGKELKNKFIPAKLNAYFALQCSASIAVSWPRIIVVDDAISVFDYPVRIVHDSGNPRNEAWPYAGAVENKTIEYNVSDGMGFISPQMSAQWSRDLNEGDEPLSGFNTRCAFLKGMVFTIDFVKFANEVAGTYEITDAWGDKRDVRDADVILTVSMLKLWDSYPNMESYLENCRKNEYEFCIAKSSPHELRNVHTTNYQYLQDFDMTDDQINELTAPTINKIKDCLGMDWRKLILYTCGIGIDEENVQSIEPIYKSIMACPEIINDQYVRQKVSKMIQKRINQAKLGVLDVEGDYAILGNDPYYLLQSIFGLKPTGLLKAGECYHKYWFDKGEEEVIMFRAPMTSHENVCKMRVVQNEDMSEWYKYIKTCCFINAFDTTAIRLNGAD